MVNSAASFAFIRVLSMTENTTPAQEKSVDTRSVLKDLQTRYPVFRDFSPLAIGIDKQLFAALPDLSRKTVRLAMRSHTMTTRYLKEMEKGTQRLNLDGSPAGDVTDENRQHASELLKERFKKQAEQRKAAEQAARAESRKQEKLLALTEKFGRKYAFPQANLCARLLCLPHCGTFAQRERQRPYSRSTSTGME